MIIILSSKRDVISKPFNSEIPFWLIVKILSVAAKSPNKTPLASIFILFTLSSNQIFLALKVEIPSDFNSILLTLFFVSIFPPEPFPLIAKSHELAVSHYLMWKCKSVDYYNGKIPQHIYKELEGRWYFLCAQARGNDEMPNPAKLEYLANMFNQLLPLPNKKYF